jgi:cobalt-zinc-cadmium efflux system outer membrane protein
MNRKGKEENLPMAGSFFLTHRLSPGRRGGLVAGVFALLFIGGCATYHPMLITPEAVDARLQPPAMAELRILASEIKHPILRPLELKPEGGLSPDGAAVLAVLLNPSLRALRDQRALASAQLVDAGLLPNPELSYSLDVPTGGDKPGTVNGYGLGLSWDITSLISRSSKIGAARARRAAVDLDIAWKEWQVAQAAKGAVYRLVSLQKQIALAEQTREQTQQNLRRIQEAVAQGSMTTTRLNAAEAASRQAEENLLEVEKEADQQRLQLSRLLGLPSDRQIQLKKDIQLPSLVELPSVTALVEGLELRRLDLVALRRGYDSQEAAVRVAILEQFPRITIGPTMGRDTENVQTTGFGLSIELPIFNHNQGKIALERATRQKLFDEYVNRVFEARSDIQLIISRIHFANQQIAAAQASETELKSLVEAYRAALADGRTDALVYYAVYSDLLSVQMKVLVLRGQLAQALVVLQLASGFYQIPKPGQSPQTLPTAPKEEKAP